MTTREPNTRHGGTIRRLDGKFTVSLRVDAFRRKCSGLGLDSDAATAEAFRLARNTIWRITTGRAEPPTAFIAAACVVLDARFEELFDIS